MITALIVDDSPDLRRLLKKALLNESICVHTAEDGQDAIEKLEAIQNPCIILLDLMMPRMDGYQFLEWKRRDSRFASYPVIILSASAQNEVPEGAVAYLKKPVNLNELVELVEAHCSRSKGKA